MSKKEPAIIKRDLRENWEKSNYIPKENVIVIMDNDDGSFSLVVGDGKTNVNKLPDLLQGAVPSKKAKIQEETLIL